MKKEKESLIIECVRQIYFGVLFIILSLPSVLCMWCGYEGLQQGSNEICYIATSLGIVSMFFVARVVGNWMVGKKND